MVRLSYKPSREEVKMRLNGLGKLGFALFVLGVAGMTGFIHGALTNSTQALYERILGQYIDPFAEFMLFAIMLMLILLGATFIGASKTSKKKLIHRDS
jgi:cytochrome bd-type quinol oxidase subunit 2